MSGGFSAGFSSGFFIGLGASIAMEKTGRAGQAVRTVPDSLIPAGFQQITGLSAVKKLTVPDSGPTIAVIQAEAQNIRWRDDGVDPSATVGMLLPAGADMVYTGNLAAIEFIEATSSGILNVSYYFG